jgi:hypothetical protein
LESGEVESIERMAMAPVFGEKKKLANSSVRLLTGGTQHRRRLIAQPMTPHLRVEHARSTMRAGGRMRVENVETE